MTVLTGILVLALIATIAILVTGIGSMTRGGEFDQRHSNQLMFARVGLHAIVVLLIALAIFLSVS
ncbi:MAG: twin transmembrane helix small protein [Gammaproteobacteria bacterium]|nr:twin transmembrane helix small protein [Gammaproteobacteria bacterium]